MTKQYRLINAQHLCTRVQVGSKSVTIKFSGGRKDSGGVLRECGSFSTDDEKLQAAIESDSGYDKVFALYGTYAPKEEASAETTPLQGEGSGDTSSQGSEGSGDTSPQGSEGSGATTLQGEGTDGAGDPTLKAVEKVEGITNTNTAKEWLEVNRGVQLGSSAKKDEVKAAAQSAGVDFVDWQ